MCRLLTLPGFGSVSFGVRCSCHLCFALILESVQDLMLASALCEQFRGIVSGVLLLLRSPFFLFPLLLGQTLRLLGLCCGLVSLLRLLLPLITFLLLRVCVLGGLFRPELAISHHR